MEILPMLARLEQALGCSDLTRQMVLKSNPLMAARSSQQDINLVVGYNDSPQSHTALDLTLWIAYQTRLASRKTVTVQVVYVIDPENSRQRANACVRTAFQHEVGDRTLPLSFSNNALEPVSTITGSQRRELSAKAMEMEMLDRADHAIDQGMNWQIHQFEQADRILWQARSLANEWRGSLETHLRFGSVATELRHVASQQSATVLILGCESADHPIVEALGEDLPCAVLGIPQRICRL
jgi:hypothetical protein